MHTLAGLVWLSNRHNCPKVQGSESLTWTALQAVCEQGAQALGT